MQNKIALVTNCSGLQGPAIAAEFQRQGATLYLQDVDIEKAKPILAKHGVDLAGDVHYVQADFSERGDAERELSEIVAETGRLDILVSNNLHEGWDKPLLKISEDEWDSTQRALLTETFYIAKAALKHMLEAKYGKIIIVTSPSWLGDFTKALGREVSGHNIQVNAIVQSGLEGSADFKDDELSEPRISKKIRQFLSTKRLVKGTEQAKLAAFLASDDSDFVRGRIIEFTARSRRPGMIMS